MQKKLLGKNGLTIRSLIVLLFCLFLLFGYMLYTHRIFAAGGKRLNSKIGYQVSPNICGSYMVSGSHTLFLDNTVPIGTTPATIDLSLWYDTCTSSNFTQVIIQGGTDNVVASVVRNPGPDGGQLIKSNFNCPTKGTCLSPEVYSPNNTAYAAMGWQSNWYVDTSSF